MKLKFVKYFVHIRSLFLRNDKVNKAPSAPSVENKENTDTSRNQSSRREAAKENSVAPGSPTEDIQLNLFKRQEPGRTEEDYRLPEQARKRPDQDCKTQWNRRYLIFCI